jgi:membrane protein involved in colicin uptake
MTTYLLAGLSLFLLLVCGVCLNAVWKAVSMQQDDREQRHYLEIALRASGLWDDYQRALRHSWELRGQAENEPRARAEAEAKAKIEAEARAARGRAIAAEAKATAEAQAEREARAAKAAK